MAEKIPDFSSDLSKPKRLVTKLVITESGDIVATDLWIEVCDLLLPEETGFVRE